MLANLLPQEHGGLGALLEFSPGAMIWTWIAFLAGLGVMWKMVYGPITKALEDRDQKVEDAIAAAETARTEAEAQMAKAKAELAKAQADSKHLIEQAMARAERQAADAVRAADERAKAELLKARETIAAEKRQAIQEIRAVAVDLTIAATAHLLHEQIDAAKNRPLVEQFVATAEAAGGGKGRR